MICRSHQGGDRRRRRIAVLALLAFALQGLSGGGHVLSLFAAAQAAEAGDFAFLVICTPQGIVKIAPDGTPWEEEQTPPASAALDACQLCCSTACSGLTARGISALALGWSDTEASGADPGPLVRQLFRPAVPGRGPPPLV